MQVNESIAAIGTHPFQRIARLLDGIEPPAGKVLDLTIGEPQFSPPSTLMGAMAERAELLNKYPPNNGPEWFRKAATTWLERAAQLPSGALDPNRSLIPVAGAREALYQLAFVVPKGGTKRFAAMPTPHYAPYRGAAMMAGLEPLYLPSTEATGFLPSLDLVEQFGAQIVIFYLCTPSNPEGAVASPEYLRRAIELARRFDFLLVSDECYSEIYLEAKPSSALTICHQESEANPVADSFKNVVTVNSLSKRSSAAGLRVGLVAGDAVVVDGLTRLRAYCGGTTSLINLAGACALLDDETHVSDTRALYKRNFDTIDRHLSGARGYRKPTAGMFLWLKVENDEAFVKEAWCRHGLKLLPGSYLGPPAFDGTDSNRQYVRVAMVHPTETLSEAAPALRDLLDTFGTQSLWHQQS